VRRFSVVVALAAVALVGGALAALYSWERFSARQTPVGQPPLLMLNAENLGQLRASFNEGEKSTRVLALLSPT
jgi:hypothetical protein